MWHTILQASAHVQREQTLARVSSDVADRYDITGVMGPDEFHKTRCITAV